MNFDFLNLSIIREFYNLKDNERAELAKIRDKIYPGCSKSKKDYFLCKIRDRLLSMPIDLFKNTKIEKGKTIVYDYHANYHNLTS